MTEDRDFKRRVRQRAQVTGEPYVLARRRLLAEEAPSPTADRADASVLRGWQLVSTELGQLHAIRHGHGGPTVVFEAGLAVPSGRVWDGIAARYAARCTVIAYDRAGHGRSRDGGLPRGPITIAGELSALLDVLDPPRPWIVVTCDRASAYGINLAVRRSEVEALVVIEPIWSPPTDDAATRVGAGLWGGAWLESRATTFARRRLRRVEGRALSRLSADARAAVTNALDDPRGQATSRQEADGFRDEGLFDAGAAGRLRDLRVSVVASPAAEAWSRVARRTGGDFVGLDEPCMSPAERIGDVEMALSHAIDIAGLP